MTSGARPGARGFGLLAAVALLAAGCGPGTRDASSSRTGGPTRSVSAPTVPAAPLPATTTTTLAAVGRTFALGVTQTTFVDPTRATSADAGFPGAPSRTFPTTVWYPASGDRAGPAVTDAPADRSGGPYPLVVFAHGYGVTPAVYEELLSRWARAGYVVAAPTYPLLSGVPVQSHADYVKAFDDTTFVITEVLRVAGGQAGSSPIQGLVDPSRIAVAGQSDGEAIAYGMGFLVCCRDARVKAVIAMAGNLGNIANPVQRDNGVPLLHLMGDADELQPYASAIAWDRDHLGVPHWSVTLVGGAHAPPYQDPSDPHFAGVVAMTTAFLDGTLKGHPERLGAIDAVAAAEPARFGVER